MKGRIRIAAVGFAVMAVLTALTSTAGAATTVTKWNVTGNGGFVSLGLLNALQLAGGGSEADASSAPVSEAEGTGLCADSTPTTNPCPTSATSSTAGNALPSTQEAVASGAGMTATPTGAHGCTIPVDVPNLISVNVSCGTASASEDAGSDPSATGTGSLAGVSISLSLTQVLQSILGGALPTASNTCGGAPAASASPGSNTGLDSVLTGVLGTANGLLGGAAPLNPTSVASGSDLTGECSILGGLLNELTASSGGASSVTGIVTGILDELLGLAGGAGVAVSPLTIDLGGSSTGVSTNGSVVTDAVTQHALDVNLFGLADLQVAPTTASVALDRSTGTVTPSCNAGVISYSIAGGVQQFLQLGSLTQLVDNILAQLSTTLNGLTSALTSLIGELLQYNPKGNLLNCNVSNPGTTANASVALVNVGLLTGLMGGVSLNVGDVSASGSSTVATPVVTTAAATPAVAPPAAAPAAAAPAAVPNVTSVHTGEFWAGDLPIILLAGMGLAGMMLIGRRRILSVARSINPLARRRGGQ